MKGWFRRIPLVYQAEQMSAPGAIQTLEGLMSYKAGDWLVTGLHDEQWPVDNQIFRQSYEPWERPDAG